MAESVELVFRFAQQGADSLDKAAQQIEKISSGAASGTTSIQSLERVVGKVGKTTEETGKSFNGLAEKIRSGVESPLALARERAVAFLETVGKAPAVIAGIALGFSVVGKAALDLVSEQGKAAESAANLADRLGITTTRAEKLQAAASIAGVNIASLEGASRQLSAALEDQTGQGAKSAEALKKLGISTVTVSGQARDMGAVVLDVLDKIGRIQSTSERARIAQETLGRAGAKELQPLIKNYSDLIATVDRLGTGLDENLVQNLAAADDEIDKLSVAWSNFKESLAGEIAPIVIPVIAKITSAIAGNGPKTQQERELDTLRGIDNSSTIDITSVFRAPSADQANRLTNDSLSRGAAASERFRRDFSNTTAGREARLKLAESQANDLRAILGSGALSAESFAIKAERLKELNGEIERLKRLISDSKEDPNKGALRLSDLFEAPQKRGKPSLFGPSVDLFGTFKVDELGPQFRNNGDGTISSVEAQQGIDRARGEGFLARLRKEIDDAKELAKIRTDAQARIIELTAGAGGELEAARRVYELRKAAAEDELGRQKARVDYETRVAEIQRQRLDSYRDAAGRVFDSLTAGGQGGVRALIAGQLKIQERAIFQNVSTGIFQRAGGFLGQIGASSGLGGLLKGTLFDPVNATGGTPVERNTSSVERLTKSVDALNQTVAGGGTGGGIASLADTVAPGGGGIIGKARQLFTGGSASRLFGGIGSIFSAGLFAGLKSGDRSIDLGNGTSTTASALGLTSTPGRIGNIAASSAAAGLSIFGVKSGIDEGGARGALTAIGSGLGLASAVPGPQQPFIQAAALVAGFVRSILPDPKQEFDRQQTELLNSRRFVGPDSQSFAFDYATGAADIDADRLGRPRVINRTINLTVNALDAKSIIDRKDDIAQATLRAVEAGHPLNNGIQQVIFGQV